MDDVRLSDLGNNPPHSVYIKVEALGIESSPLETSDVQLRQGAPLRFSWSHTLRFLRGSVEWETLAKAVDAVRAAGSSLVAAFPSTYSSLVFPTYLQQPRPSHLLTAASSFLPTYSSLVLPTYLQQPRPSYLLTAASSFLPTYSSLVAAFLLTYSPTYLPTCLHACLPTYLPIY